MRGTLIAPKPGIITKDHPLWRGLVFAMPGWTPDDIVSGLKATINGSTTTTVGQYGLAINQGGTSSYIRYADVNSDADPTWHRTGLMGGPVTVMAVHTPSSSAVTCLFNYSGVLSAQSPFALVWSEGTSSKYSFWNDDYGPAHGAENSSTSALNVPHVVIGRRYGRISASPNMDLWVDGAQVASASSVAEDSWNVTDDRPPHYLCINRFGGWDSYYGAGTIHAVYAWSRPLSDGECRQLSDDPWCFFRPTTTRKYVTFLVDGGDTTVLITGASADVGIGTVTVFIPTVCLPSGSAASSTVGTLTPVVIKSPDASTASPAIGTVTVDIQAVITCLPGGASSSSTVGTLTPAVVIKSPAAAAVTPAVGSLTPVVLFAPEASTTTCAAGTSIEEVKFVVTGATADAQAGIAQIWHLVPDGATASANAGTAGVGNAFTPEAASTTAVAGTATATASVIVTTDGAAASAAIGTVTPLIIKSPTAVTASPSVGTVTTLVTTTILPS